MTLIQEKDNTFEREILQDMTINREANEMINNIEDINHAKRIIKRLQSERERMMRSLSLSTLKTIIKESK